MINTWTFSTPRRTSAWQGSRSSATSCISRNTSDYVSDMSTNLEEQDNDVEFVDPRDAIETFYSQMYCYNAAIKVGSQILQQSLIDYLK